MFVFSQRNRGFTLLELLVVISIIGLLSSLVFASLSKARASSRDARRLSDLKQMQLALTLYYAENHAYPVAGSWRSSEPGSQFIYDAVTGYIPGLAPTYIDTLPRDPKGGAAPNCGGAYLNEYLYISDGAEYKLLSHCSPEGAWTSSHSAYDPVRPTWAWMTCAGSTICNW